MKMLTDGDRAEIRRRFLAVDASNVADVLDARGVHDQGIAPFIRAISQGQIAGWAYTVVGEMAPYEGTGDPAKMEACAGIGQDEVSVWCGGGHGVCYFGELIALGMAEQGSVGALVDGGVRDVKWLKEHGFPVFAGYVTPIQSIGRWHVTSWQTPAYVHGATSTWVVVHPGDFILGDQDGCLVIPAEMTLEVLVAAEKLTQTEVEIRDALRGGASLSACLDHFGHV